MFKTFHFLQIKPRTSRLAFILLIGLALLASACNGYSVSAPVAAAAATSLPVVAKPTATPTAMTPATPTAMPPTSQASTGLKAYIGLFKDNAVAVLDTRTSTVLSRIPVPAGPHGLVITPDNRRVYVSSDGDSKVSVIDTATDKVVDTIEVGKNPHGLAITPDGQLIYVAVFGANQMDIIDTRTDAVIFQTAVASPHNIAISPDGSTAYIASQLASAPSLAIFDFNKLSITGAVSLTKVPRALNFSPDGKLLYFTQAGIDAVQVLDPATSMVSDPIQVGASPHMPLFTLDGKTALVVSQEPGTLSILDPKTNSVRQVVTVGKMPHWIAVDAQGTTAWVTNEASNDVSVVDLAKGVVTATIPVGNAPRKIVVQRFAPDSTPTPVSNQTGASIVISGMAFNMPAVTVKVGTTITWVNQDSIAHTVTADQGKWDSGPIDPGKSFSLTLTDPGKYGYHCSIHPFMQGAVIVMQ